MQKIIASRSGRQNSVEMLEKEAAELLLEMERQMAYESGEAFRDWWQSEAGEKRYFSLRREIESRKEAGRKEKLREAFLRQYLEEA